MEMTIFLDVIRVVVWLTGLVGGAMALYGCYDLACMVFGGWKE